MMRLSSREDDGSNMRARKVTLNNLCGLEAEKEKSYLQVAQRLS